MKNLKFLLLFLFVIPIVKADGCGISCPHGNDLFTFSLSMLCQFFTWGFCHIFAFVILVITGIIIFAFWLIQPDEKRKHIKLYLWGLFGIFIMIILYPYIKAFTYTSIEPCNGDTWSTYNGHETECSLSAEANGYDSKMHTSNNGCLINSCKYRCISGTPTVAGQVTVNYGNSDKDTLAYVTVNAWYTATITNLPIPPVEYTIVLYCEGAT